MTIGLTGIDAVEAEMRDRLAARDDEIERLQGEHAAAVIGERKAVVKWLRDCADECPTPEVAKMFRHEANGIERGLHRMEGQR